MPEAPITPGQQGFNKWHADVARSAASDLIVRRVLALPAHAVSNSLLSWSAIPETRRMNLARDLAAAGFTEIEVTSRADWHEIERALWESVIRTDPADEPAGDPTDGPADDPGLDSLRNEAARVLDGYDSKRRVLATATAPATPGQ